MLNSNDDHTALPSFVNLCPAMLDPIPWGWENVFHNGFPQVAKSPGKIVMPQVWKYFHWNMIDYEGTDECEENIFGTKNMKSVFTTAGRFLGYEKLLIEQPRLRDITNEFLLWNELLLLASPEKITYFVLGDDVAGNNGPLVSPEVFHSWILPEWKLLADFAHNHDCKLVIHSDGDIWKLLDDILGLDPWGLSYQPVGKMINAPKALGHIVELFANVQ